MSDLNVNSPIYRSLNGDAPLGGPVRRSGIGLMRPFAVIAAIIGVGVVISFLLSSPDRESVVDKEPREEFRPVQTPRNEGFRVPAPPPLPTVQVPEAPPPPPPTPPALVVPAAAPAFAPAEVDCTRGKNPDNPHCIELARQAKLLERVRSAAVVFDKNEVHGAAQDSRDEQTNSSFLMGSPSSGAAPPAFDNGGPINGANDGDRTFLKAMGGQGVQVSVATGNRRTDAWIPQGTMIRGTLETAVNSDLAGMVKGIVREDVYSFDGRRILIPAGSSLIGDYKSGVERGQERILIVWTRMIRGDGVSVQLGSYGTDRLGRSGMTGIVDRKYLERFGPPALMTLIGGATQYIAQLGQKENRYITITNRDGSVTRVPQNSGENSQDRARQIAAETIASGIQQLGSEAFEDSRNIRPTIHVPQGSDINVFVTRDLDFSGLYVDPVREEFDRLRKTRGRK